MFSQTRPNPHPALPSGARQPGLFGAGPVAIDASLRGVTRFELGAGAFVDHLPGWVQGHESLLDAVMEQVTWRGESREMYDRVVEVPRVFATGDGQSVHPVVEDIRLALEARYRLALPNVGIAMYRDGRDSVAWHGDTWARELEVSMVATVSVGAPRPFLVRPVPGTLGGHLRLELGWGDLVVMGGTCQRSHQHCVPKVPRADPRVVLMFRPDVDEPG